MDLEWLHAMLKQVMADVMAGDDPPLKKANALARLGSLYLKTCRTAELEQANKELSHRLDSLEARLAAAESTRVDEEFWRGNGRDSSGENTGLALPMPHAVAAPFGTPPSADGPPLTPPTNQFADFDAREPPLGPFPDDSVSTRGSP